MSQKKKTRRPDKRESAPQELGNENSQPGVQSSEPVGQQRVHLSRTNSLRVFTTAVFSLLILWFSFPPVGLAWLAWLAPIPLIWLVQTETLPGRRPYWQLWFAGLIYWLGTFYFIPIPFPQVLWIGWIAVSTYMACYTPMFIGVARTLVHRFKLPSLLVVPIVWTGIEWIRCNFATGMAMVCLSHSQYKTPILLQVGDLFGAYTLTFAMVLFATGIASAVAIGAFSTSAKTNMKSRVAGLAVSAAVISVVLLYGQFRLNEEIKYKSDSTLAVALIQSSNDVVFRELTEDEAMSQLVEKYQLTWSARKEWSDLDLVVWPESAFYPYADLLSDFSDEATVEAVANTRTQIWSDAVGYPDHFQTPIPLLTGGGTRDPANDKSFASAFLIANDGLIETRYFKNHLVMVGEYVPLANWFPFIQKVSPIGKGIDAGIQFEVVSRNGVNIAPSICFESTIPHLIRRQINTLTNSGAEPDVMINLTNDGWFLGTSCLDFHLACNVFRAIEMRKPHLICANTGLSAEIDSCGRLIQTGPRRETKVLRADVRPIERSSLYRTIGDLIPILFAGISLIAGCVGWWNRKRN